VPKEGLETELPGTDQLETSRIARDENGAEEDDPPFKCAIVRVETKPSDETPASEEPIEPLADAAVLLSLAEAVENLMAAGSVDLARIALGQLRGLLPAAQGRSGEIVDLTMGVRRHR
jgi:hypothetical protein